MTRRLHLAALALLACSAGSGAKNLGTWGNLFEPAEQDMLVFIQNRLGAMEKSGELERLQREATDRVKAHAVRPAPVPGLTAASENRTFIFDPTFTVAETITDMSGRIIALKGDRVNPLDRVPYNETLFFIDGDNADQMAWIRNEIGKTTEFKVILVNGNIRETSEALDERVYFDQAGVLTTKFGFTHTPVRITRDDRALKIEEIALKGVKK
ncbi:type-F conjugative transfer system protein TraW [Cronobacter sakazakii]|uniref:type-F conjugative transfer system protein TraW n=1 Tax=Cronobacter sakazakii TaxID=28141 RepID=UPI001F50FD5B|nr:type-F conjugative transfer system protein TraW [Cronobacter sakazakii]MCI0288068.1 type-F conjugative transfer system protein TraW [Cronobacter sakazakii]